MGGLWCINESFQHLQLYLTAFSKLLHSTHPSKMAKLIVQYYLALFHSSNYKLYSPQARQIRSISS